MNLFRSLSPLPKFDLHYAIITAKRKTILRGSFGVEFFFQDKDENNLIRSHLKIKLAQLFHLKKTNKQ